MIESWILLALIGYGLASVSGVIDRAIVHQEKTTPAVISFWVALYSILTIGILLVGLIPGEAFEAFRFQMPSAEIFGFALLAGLMVQAALFFSYNSFEHGEATRVISTMGAITPIVSFAAAYVFLDERLNTIVSIGFILLILATIVLTIPSRRRGIKYDSKWVTYALLAGFTLGLQSVVAKYIYDNFQFISAYALTGLGAGFYVVLLAAFAPSVRKEIAGLSNPQPLKKNAKPQTSSQKWWILGNSVLGGIAIIILNYAINLGSPSLVNAMRGVQYAGVFVIAVLLSKKIPKLLDEDLSYRSVMLKLIGIVLIVNGVILLASQS